MQTLTALTSFIGFTLIALLVIGETARVWRSLFKGD